MLSFLLLSTKIIKLNLCKNEILVLRLDHSIRLDCIKNVVGDSISVGEI